MKTLVTDDELVSRNKLQKIMENFGESIAAENGKAAIARINEAFDKGARFDVITLDVSMPEMDGKEVLLAIRELERKKGLSKDEQIKVLMVSSNVEKDTIMTCIQAGCNDYIAKPVDKDKIINKLKKLGLIKQAEEQVDPAQNQKSNKFDIVKEITSRFKSGEIVLPSLPKITNKFRELVDKGADLKEIAELLRTDTSISAKLISVSNSPYYRGVDENLTLDQAIGRLGLKTTRQYVDVICNRNLYDKNTSKKYLLITEKLWTHSLTCAYASQTIVQTLGLVLKEDAFTLGLFHDIGKLILIRIINEFEEKGKFGGEAPQEELLDTLEKLHGSFGAALLKRWRFSGIYQNVALSHDSQIGSEGKSKELLVINFANLLVKSMGYFIQDNPGSTDLEGTDSNAILNLDPEKIETIKGEVKDQLAAVGGIIT